MTDVPVVIFAVALAVLWLSAEGGAYLGKRRRKLDEDTRQDYSVILTATLTLLGLIIGFTFSMAVTRYDQRKNYEGEEANAIGTEYCRAGLLPGAAVGETRALLVRYLHERVLFYHTRDARELEQINARTTKLQAELWSAVQAGAAVQPTPTVALAVAGMNDVLNRQGYTQAAWWNRIPPPAWALMSMVAICGNALFGFTTRHMGRNDKLFLVLPLIVAISFFLIADLDSPRWGVIRVHPQNLLNLTGSMGQ
jgi:hypothetical protein